MSGILERSIKSFVILSAVALNVAGPKLTAGDTATPEATNASSAAPVAGPTPLASALGVAFVEGSTSSLTVERGGKKYLVDVSARTITEVQASPAPAASALQAPDSAQSAQKTTAEDAIRGEHQREAATQVSVANVITSLRLCSTLDWTEYVERVSLVERVLQRDPAGVHGRMEFLSRDRYRQAVEELAEPTGEAQVRVALRAVESARQAAESEGPGARAAHVGHHLIGKGRRELEADVAWRPGPAKLLRRFVFAHVTAAYLGTIALATAALLAAGVAYVRNEGGSPWAQAGVALLLLVPASEVAIALVQRLAARFAPPRRLPRLDLSAGVPEDARTLVVVPTLLTSVEIVEGWWVLLQDAYVLAWSVWQRAI